MVRVVGVVALSFLLAGCASAPSGSQEGGTTGTSSGSLQTLRYMETHLPTAVSLAKFELIEERGASLLYPMRDDEPRQVGPGIHRLPYGATPFVGAQRERYHSEITGLLNQGPPPTTSVSMLVVTSDQPLNLDPFLRASSGLRDLLGTRAYTTRFWGWRGFSEPWSEILSRLSPNTASSQLPFLAGGRFGDDPQALACRNLRDPTLTNS